MEAAMTRQTSSKTFRLASLATVLTGAILFTFSAFAADNADRRYLNFLNALGEPALIGANADHELASSAYRPLPAFGVAEIDADKLRLGFDLFHERRLSVDNSTGCNSCHSGMFGGTDGRRVSVGVNGALGALNAPTTFNAAYNFRQFWDGRAVDLKEQALGPIENELEMAHSLNAVIDMLNADSSYPTEFARIYPDGISAHNMADALAYFQTINFSRGGTPFVQHLNGVENQLSDQAMRGWQRFDEIGCASCHNGINLGGNSYQQLGAALPYYVEHRTPGPHDNGLMGRSGRDDDLHVFKVPTLHGIAETAPYFHDGSIETLESAIEEMAEHQLGRLLNEQDVDDIAAFLRSMGGRPMGMGGRGGMGNMGMGSGMGMRQGMNQGEDRAMDQGMSQGMSQGMRMGQGGGMGRRGQQSQASTDADTTAQIAAPPPSADHYAQYSLAISVVNSALTRLTDEMQRIHTEDVAHYDFLQFEHLQLIRNARALHYPPASVDKTTHDSLNALAQQLLIAANDLEWLISDFLRAEAMIKVMSSHIEFPEDSELAGEMGDPLQLWQQYRESANGLIRQIGESQVTIVAAQLRDVYSR
jgi:cytochrome c peroxidase